MDLKYSTQEVQNLPEQSCNNALMAKKKSPKDNKCPKSQEIRRRKNKIKSSKRSERGDRTN